jgi:hypothetical protein
MNRELADAFEAAMKQARGDLERGDAKEAAVHSKGRLVIRVSVTDTRKGSGLRGLRALFAVNTAASGAWPSGHVCRPAR